MSTSHRTISSLAGRSVTVRRPGGRWLAVAASVVSVLAGLQAGEASEQRTLRERALLVGRHMMATIGHRVVSPVRLEVLSDSAEAVTGGFTQALTEAGAAPRLTELTGTTGTVVIVRRTLDGDSGLDVRVEQWPERSVLYSRLWIAGSESLDDETEGFIDRMVVPVIVGAAVAIIVYLFFTVRS